MVTFKEMLILEKQKYLNIKKALDKKEVDFVEGRLVIKSNKSIKEYYQVKHLNNKKEVKYISKDNPKLIKSLANKSYLPKLKKLVNKRLYQLNNILKDYSETEIDDIYENLNTYRKELITPVVPTAKQNLETWKATPYSGNEFVTNAPLIDTNKGDQVKSKSEKIIADKLYALGIPYKYECPLVIDKYTKFYPDFTLIDPFTNKEMYWEHFGMIDNPEYAAAAIKKIAIYEKNGIQMGINLIVSFESSKSGLDNSYIDCLIKRYFIKHVE
ncbi:hypothetical protein [Helcococcus kunzii]|uniref:hypothetical protein n=1 Tax=Helcococcus kunzii TaxID=40091 RepID=UPI001BAF439D|nr:hypothetical protein [Helcococcus kunzii]QUY64153.1 hypothetical protein GUI37_00940 [Helcococcus kunzii]QZO76608.1 hypothetical protein HIF96_00875 [Helcococcus kunzii]